MIDLHSHLLPGIDDGAKDMAMALEMARMAVADGTRLLACTPHFMPGVYDTSMSRLTSAISEFRRELKARDIPLTIISGGDVHVAPDLPQKLAEGSVPVLQGTRYFLFEPPHHVLPPHLDKLCSRLIEAGFIPILTHPERLTWIESHYDLICRLDAMGVPIQLTAGSVTGDFGKRAKYWSERMIDEGRADLIASDAHNLKSRRPGLSRARDEIARSAGDDVAQQMVLFNPISILKNRVFKSREYKKPVENTEGKYLSIFRSMIS